MSWIEGWASSIGISVRDDTRDGTRPWGSIPSRFWTRIDGCDPKNVELLVVRRRASPVVDVRITNSALAAGCPGKEARLWAVAMFWPTPLPDLCTPAWCNQIPPAKAAKRVERLFKFAAVVASLTTLAIRDAFGADETGLLKSISLPAPLLLDDATGAR